MAAPLRQFSEGALRVACHERADKPNSVPADSHLLAVIISLGRRLPAVSCDQPKGQDEQPCDVQPVGPGIMPSYLVLLPMGFT